MAYRYPLAATTTAAALFLALGIVSCEAFVSPTTSRSHVSRNSCVTAPASAIVLSMSSNDNDPDAHDKADDEPSDASSDASSHPEDRTNVDSMRSLLESSWNIGTMGAVPTSPQSAAHSASEAIGSALSRNKKLLQVDIRLPSFDVTQGPNIYDEISSVEFCCQLADNLCSDGNCNKALILVRDGSAVRSAARILDVKERRRRQDEEEREARLMLDKEDEEEEDEDDVVSASTAEDESSPTGSGGGSDDIDSFRKQLLSGWGDDDDGTSTSSNREQEMDPANDPSMIAASRTRRGREELKPSVTFDPSASAASTSTSSAGTKSVTDRSYRLGSLFGDDAVSTGADMFADAIEAVDTHGSMLNIEDVLIILAPVTREDTVATRRLISRYKDTKTIVLVNNRLYPEPKELFLSEPVYSITPLVARAMKSEGNFMRNQSDDDGREDDEAPPTKIIVMRRYPTDWEIFVDVDGNGFELVDSAPAVAVGKTGPDNEFVAGCVKKHMAFKFGQY
mmetsp:Transcript_15292/g.33253  ORF Transcript_15292/g.33253 Transcript_15292/m.33253 type:complete len:508 (+) Transcript_15292:73-1596(+)